MSWVVDTHVHYQSCFGWQRFLTGALANLDRVAAKSVGVSAGCLLFVDQEGNESLALLRKAQSQGDSLPRGCTISTTAESGALRLHRSGAPPLLLVAGRQLATREGLEVLALCCSATIADGKSLGDSVQAVRDAGAIAVIPWGFGKWWLGRGRIARDFLEGERAAPIFLGDNGNRPELGARPKLFDIAERQRIAILPGSDPLPFTHHAGRALSYGLELGGQLDSEKPGASVRCALGDPDLSPAPIGRRVNLPRFVADQLSMQVLVRGRGARARDNSPVEKT